MLRRFLNPLAAMVIVAVITPAASAGVLLATFVFLPLPANLPARPPHDASQISRVFDADGNQIATFREFETSIPVRKQDIPDVVKQAVIAAEDRNFYTHGGVDLRGTLRALWADLRNRNAVQGGSTITQQLVKNTYTGGERSLNRKIREAVLASQLDRQEDKDDILYEYLSIIYLGEGAYGVGAAAETYFRKSVKDLTLGEAALIAGVIPAPSRFSPRVDPAAAEIRRSQVLDTMLRLKMITTKEHAKWRGRRVWLAADGTPVRPATIVYPPESQHTAEPYFSDYVLRYLSDVLPGGERQVDTGGLRIETTLDPRMQAAARAGIDGFLEGTNPELQASMVAVEPPTGFVRAFIGGRDWNASRVNFALGKDGGGAGRSTGSAFKPFVLATAFEQGISPDKVYSGAPHKVAGKKDPIGNYGGARFGSLPLRVATWKSVNTVYTRLIDDVGVEQTMDVARRMGLTSVPPFDPARHAEAVALGVLETSPLQMASAFGVFANHGEREAPTPVLRVYDRGGKLILDNSNRKPERAIKEDVADNVTDVLKGVIEKGTAAGRGINRPAAGKTGTANDNKDAWFVGYTPVLSTAVWMGFENKPGDPPKFLKPPWFGSRPVTGGSFPSMIWQTFMKKALEDIPITEFNQPAPIRAIADDRKRAARGFFDPGPRMYPRGGSGGPYVVGLDPPIADAPTSTTSTSIDSTTTSEGTTTTTRPPIIIN
jgi:penicillin-binding protein 1A